ncbi:unnamed protein product [Linum tenue]|uniref:N-acetyltransferase domain-containing protein n=1 Tax=Linum tenue TaxID=586396 RepID=A0AAV0S7J4_9ROSI|nr:unnamed protein product [Linum tenue]
MPTTTVSIHAPPEFLTFPASVASRNIHKLSTVTASWRMSMDSGSFQTKKREELSLHIHHPAAFDPKWDTPRQPDLRFDRLQIPEQDLKELNKLEFGQFVAREALIDEEYWTAAWLRAESLWENRDKDSTGSFLNWWQEFHAIRRRLIGPYGQKSKCIITLRKQDEKVKRTVLKSVVGTLDLSIRSLLPGEIFPGEHGKAPHFCNIDGGGEDRYSYVSNLVVSLSARRQGIATNMMQFVVETAKSSAGVEHLYVHVDRNNKLAQQLYDKMGFKMIEEASDGLVEDNTFLLRCRL